MEPELEAAALGANAPRAQALAAVTSPEGDRAVVLAQFQGGHELHRFCNRTRDGWALAEDDPACSAGTCWSSTGSGGVWHISGHAPAGVAAVKLQWRGQAHEIPVKGRRYLVAWWDLPESAIDDEPELAAYVWADGVETKVLA